MKGNNAPKAKKPYKAPKLRELGGLGRRTRANFQGLGMPDGIPIKDFREMS